MSEEDIVKSILRKKIGIRKSLEMTQDQWDEMVQEVMEVNERVQREEEVEWVASNSNKVFPDLDKNVHTLKRNSPLYWKVKILGRKAPQDPNAEVALDVRFYKGGLYILGEGEE